MVDFGFFVGKIKIMRAFDKNLMTDAILTIQQFNLFFIVSKGD